MNILVVTSRAAADPDVEAVTARLDERGARLVRFDTDRFPTEARLTLAPGAGDGFHLSLSSDDEETDLSAVSSVWMRHPAVGAGLPDDMEPSHREAGRLQSDAMVWSALECLSCFQLDPARVLRAAPHKPRQLQLARAAGLDVPLTVISNDPQAVRALVARCPGGVIAKLIDNGPLTVVGEGGVEGPLPTIALTADALDELDGLAYGPMIFQERLDKRLELRVTVVGRKLFSAGVDPGASTSGQEDWRVDPALVGGFRPHPLPAPVEARLFALLDALELNFAAVDFIVSKDGRCVFLEVNSPGFFSFVEQASGLPISAAVADLLCGREAPRLQPRLR